MKNAITLLICLGSFAITTAVYAGENGASSLLAEKICSPQIDIFNATSMESLLALPEGQKLANYQVVLLLPNMVYKYSLESAGDFKRVMSWVKEHAAPGAMLFVDEMKTTTNQSVPQAGFYLRNGF